MGIGIEQKSAGFEALMLSDLFALRLLPKVL